MNTSLFALLVVFLVQVAGYGEPDSTGHPTWQERANHLFINAVRIDPLNYKAVYMAGYSPSPASILVNYPATYPLYIEPKLDASAFNHSNDMAIHNCFQHPSCDGTDPFVRIESFYPCSGWMGENIAAGLSDPLSANNLLVCDSTGGACAADGSGNDGHRSNMMSNNYRVCGTGFAYSSTSTYHYYLTQDFGGAACAPAPTTPIFDGSHYISNGNTKFIALYYNSASPSTPPSSASVVIAGSSFALSLDIGKAGNATYALSQTSGTGCRSYYFTFGTNRYPTTGCLVTYGEGTCTTSFDATCGTSTTATTAATTATSSTATHATSATAATSTTKASTTKASTTKAATTKSATSTSTHATSTSTSTHATVATSTATSTVAATSSTATTGTGGTYYLYTSSIQNSWVLEYNSGVVVTNSFTYSGKTGLSVALTGSGSDNFFFFAHNPGVNNVWTSLQFNAAASVAGQIVIYFNGGYYVEESLTTNWQLFTIPLTSIANPSTGAPYTTPGNPPLVFQTASTSMTLYLNNVAFV